MFAVEQAEKANVMIRNWKCVLVAIGCLAVLGGLSRAVSEEPEIATELEVYVTPPLLSDTEKDIWGVLTTVPPSQFHLHLPQQGSDSDLVRSVEGWLAADGVVDSLETRQLIYQFITGTRLKTSKSAENVLISGTSDDDARIRRMSAKALLEGATPAIGQVDSALAEYLSSDSTSRNDRAVLLELIATRKPTLGEKVHSFLEAGVLADWAQGPEIFWGTYVLLNSKSGAILPELLNVVNDSAKIGEILRAVSMYSGTTGGTLDVTPEVRMEIKAAFLKLLSSEDPRVRFSAVRNIFSQMGPTPYSASNEQIALNRRVQNAVIELQSRKTDPEVKKYIQEYVLLAFESDGTLKSKKEWREDINKVKEKS
jgi:hypothetical protein